MRMYALYDRSRKVLALYIIVAAVILAVACVSFNFDGNNYLPSRSESLADSVAYIVGSTGWKKRKTLEHSNTHWLPCSVESGKVSTSPWHSVQVYMTQALNLFLQSHPCVPGENFLSWWDIPTLTHTGSGIAWAGLLVFDSLIFGMTLYKSIVLPRPNRVNILDILLRDGELYLSGNSFFLINIQGAIYFG
jgi:hypothetical protein